jgi:hypothetical protein
MAAASSHLGSSSRCASTVNRSAQKIQIGTRTLNVGDGG